MNAPQLERILPTDSEIARPYWEGCRLGELRLQHCASCDQYQFYPRILCSHCSASDLSWRRVSGQAVVSSFTVVRRAVSPAYAAPYVVALVTLDEGPCMMTNIVIDDPQKVSVGAAVNVMFEPWGADYVLPVFCLVE